MLMQHLSDASRQGKPGPKRLGPEQRDYSSELRRIIAGILGTGGVVTGIPELRIKRPLSCAEGDVYVTPQRIDPDGIPTGCVRPRPHSINQIRGQRTLRD